MPYYLEQFVNRTEPVSFTPFGTLQDSGQVVMDSTELMTFRGRPHKDAVYSQELSDISVDPYAYFLEETTRKRYHDRLKERDLKPEGDPDRGHAFELKRHTMYGRPRTVVTNAGGAISTWEGCWVTPSIGSDFNEVHGGNFFDPAPYKETGLDAFAQQAYNRSAPTAVVFDAGQFLGELREGLPRLGSEFLQSQLSSFKKAGSDYLNLEFGWKPFIADIQNAGKALFSATNSFSQMGKRVHRRYELPESESHGVGHFPVSSAQIFQFYSRGVASHYTASSAAGNTGSARLNTYHSVEKTRTSKRWFEGEFTAFMPLGFDPNDYFQRLSALVNPKITPATLWELAPWSWLIDWNLRIGDSIQANLATANDKLVMHYGYAMETTVYETKVEWGTSSERATSTVYTNRPKFGTLHSQTEYKRRLRANPYGFRVGGSGSLTGGQAAILGALGLTKFK